MKFLRIFASVILAIVLLIILIWLIGPQAFIQNIHALSPLLFMPLYALFTILWLIKGFRWSLLLRDQGYILSVPTATSLSLIGNYSNLLIPAKLGDSVWIYTAHKRNNIRISSAITTVFLDRFYDFLTIILFALASMVFLLGSADIPSWMYYILYVGISGILLFLIAVYLLIRNEEKFINFVRHERITKLIHVAASNLGRSAQNYRRSLIIIILSLVVWLIQTMMCYLIAKSLEGNISFAIIALAIAITNLTMVIPLTPSNIGIYESAFIAVLMLGGIESNVALTIGIIDHLVKVSYVAIVGSIISGYYSISIRPMMYDRG